MWDFKVQGTEKKARYRIIADALERDILSGELAPGARLMTHRELAAKTGVTVSTVTRAYAEAEKRGLVKTMVGRGTFVLEHGLHTSTAQDSWAGTVVELGVAMPLPSEEPSIKPLLQKVVLEGDVDALVKSFAPLGYHEHREIGARWLRRAGVAATAESVLITNGHQHSLVSIFCSLFEPGDSIAVDYLTNPGFKTLVQRGGLELAGVMIDEDGMVPEALDALCKTTPIRGIYMTGNVQNPSAKPIPPDRRKALCNIIDRHKLILVEDGTFNVMDTHRDRTLSSLLPDSSVYFTSASSAIYAGLRVAFVHAPVKFHNRIAQAIVANVWTVAPLCVSLMCEAFASGIVEKTLKKKQKEMERRVALLQDTLGDFTVTCSDQTIYAWLFLPSPWSSRDFEQEAEKNGVRVLSADRFVVGMHPAPNCVRLAFTGPSEISTLKKGLDILVSILKKEGGIISPIW